MSHEAERTAVEQLFLKVTLPIIVQDKGRFGIVGTATLFTIQDRPFLVTADYSVDRWAYSEHPVHHAARRRSDVAARGARAAADAGGGAPNARASYGCIATRSLILSFTLSGSRLSLLLLSGWTASS